MLASGDGTALSPARRGATLAPHAPSVPPCLSHALPLRAPSKRAITAIAILSAIAAAALGAVPARAVTLLTDENPPFSFTEKGKVRGSAAEVVQDMAARAGVPAAVEVLPWEKAYVRAQGQKDACLFATARLENRERLFLWVGPIATNPWAVYGRGDFAVAHPQREGARAATRSARWSGTRRTIFLRENGVNELRAVRDDGQNPPRLLLPRDHPEHIDLWITGPLRGSRRRQGGESDRHQGRFHRAGTSRSTSRCNPQTDRKTVKALSDALEAMKADGSRQPDHRRLRKALSALLLRGDSPCALAGALRAAARVA